VPATSRVYTLRHAARLLGETEDTISDAAIGMFPEDGAIQIIDDNFGDEDWALASAFTDEGIENLDTSSTKPGSAARSTICANLEGAHRMHTFKRFRSLQKVPLLQRWPDALDSQIWIPFENARRPSRSSFSIGRSKALYRGCRNARIAKSAPMLIEQPQAMPVNTIVPTYRIGALVCQCHPYFALTHPVTRPS
jgi:hypothetical protein